LKTTQWVADDDLATGVLDIQNNLAGNIYLANPEKEDIASMVLQD
jgi:hypothetical protein